MRHVFTTREKVLLVILAVLVIAVGYWKLILTPINDSIADLNAQTASEQDAILTNSARLSRMRQMQQELETLLADPDAKPLPDYDNSERLLVELNTILSGTVDYTLSFGGHLPAGGRRQHHLPSHLAGVHLRLLHRRTDCDGCAPRQ